VRGDVHVLRAPRGSRGSEQHGRRFAVVVQSDLLPLSTLLVAPTSRSARPASFRAVVEVAGEPTTVLLDQTSAVDPSRLGPVVGHLRHDEMAAVAAGLRRVFGLDGLEGPEG
jgi:mRNA interferase MazF